jgi:hypothetical protein
MEFCELLEIVSDRKNLQKSRTSSSKDTTPLFSGKIKALKSDYFSENYD